ncbi:MAG: hypothetical protein COA60_000130 [Robiginitomaculum sp.]|nr:hypothetical protein [Robiginitomaculum sp.]
MWPLALLALEPQIGNAPMNTAMQTKEIRQIVTRKKTMQKTTGNCSYQSPSIFNYPYKYVVNWPTMRNCRLISTQLWSNGLPISGGEPLPGEQSTISQQYCDSTGYKLFGGHKAEYMDSRTPSVISDLTVFHWGDKKQCNPHKIPPFLNTSILQPANECRKIIRRVTCYAPSWTTTPINIKYPQTTVAGFGGLPFSFFAKYRSTDPLSERGTKRVAEAICGKLTNPQRPYALHWTIKNAIGYERRGVFIGDNVTCLDSSQCKYKIINFVACDTKPRPKISTVNSSAND